MLLGLAPAQHQHLGQAGLKEEPVGLMGLKLPGKEAAVGKMKTFREIGPVSQKCTNSRSLMTQYQSFFLFVFLTLGLMRPQSAGLDP